MTRTITILFTALLLSGSALADGVLKPAHGGRMVEVAGQRLELVIADEQVDLFVTSHDNSPVAVDKATGKITLLVGVEKRDVVLAPAGSNRLSAKGAFSGTSQSAAIITVEGLAKRLTARIPTGHP